MTPLRELLESLGPSLKSVDIGTETRAADKIECLKKEEPGLLNADAYSATIGTVRVVMVLDDHGGPAFCTWRVYGFFFENNRTQNNEVKT
ncbi:MAG: hypothetical protein WCO94_03865 [Verrucomicrobiota bacterium]